MVMAAQLSNASWPSLLPPPDQLRFIDRGFGSEVYGVPGTIAVRIARTPEAGQALARESALLGALANRLPVEVASPVWAAGPSDEEPYGVLALEWVGGTTPADADDVPDLGELVEFLVALHSLPPSLVEPIGLPDQAAVAARRHADAALTRNVVKQRWKSSEVRAFERWLERVLRLLTVGDDLPVLVHGDFWYGNLRVADDGLQAVLDWEAASVSDRAADLGPILYQGADAFDEALREYTRHLKLDRAAITARAQASCEVRELSGIRACVSANDLEELDCELEKLRRHL